LKDNDSFQIAPPSKRSGGAERRAASGSVSSERRTARRIASLACRSKGRSHPDADRPETLLQERAREPERERALAGAGDALDHDRVLELGIADEIEHGLDDRLAAADLLVERIERGARRGDLAPGELAAVEIDVDVGERERLGPERGDLLEEAALEIGVLDQRLERGQLAGAELEPLEHRRELLAQRPVRDDRLQVDDEAAVDLAEEAPALGLV
jgi:hypothetical protein